MNIHFTPLERSHFPLLLTWLEAPHVKEWWNPETTWTLERVSQKYESYTKGYKEQDGIKKKMYAFIISLEDAPIGYIQYYDVTDFPREVSLEGLHLPVSCAALDWYIGEKERLGKGYAAPLLDRFLKEKVFKHFKAVLVDPDAPNLRAIRAYQKAGFQKVSVCQKQNVTFFLRKKEEKDN